MEFLILMLIVIILIIGIPIILSIIIYNFTKKLNIDKRFRLFAVIPIAIISFIIYTAFCPLDEFYKEKYKEVTLLDFPEKGIIKHKTASYPDQFGDYTACFVVELDSKSLKLLKNNLLKNGFIEKSYWIGCNEMNYINKKIEMKKYVN